MICCPKFSNNAQILINCFSQFVTLSTYPTTSPCTAVPGNLLWCCSRHSRDRVERNSRQRAQQTTGANTRCFDLHHFYINMLQTFTFITGSMCSTVKIGNRLRCGRPKDRCSISVNSRLLCSNPHTPDLKKGRLNILFKGNQPHFFCGERLQRATPNIVGYAAGLKWKNRSILYT